MKISTLDFKRGSTFWLTILFYFVCGLTLLIWPDFAFNFAGYVLGSFLCILGILSIVRYVRAPILSSLLNMQLSLGLILICFGVLLFFNPGFVAEALPFVWGIFLLIGGFGKVQMSTDLNRMGVSYWWVILIGAILSFVLGGFAVARPAFIASVLAVFAGISLIVESVIDLISYLLLSSKVKAYKKKLESQTIEL